MPVMAIQGYGSLRRRLKIPKKRPAVEGNTRKITPMILSVNVGSPKRRDSNRVRTKSIANEMSKRSKDIDPKLDFILSFFTSK